MDDIRLSNGVRIPDAELQWTFLPSGGPGGQHANRAASKVMLRFDPASSAAFDHDTRTRLLDRVGGMMVVTVDDSRSQWRNRRIARRRLRERIERAIAPSPPERKAARPSRAAAEQRLEEKRQRSERKRLRRRPEVDD
jgi:ribosome-associated protein